MPDAYSSVCELFDTICLGPSHRRPSRLARAALLLLPDPRGRLSQCAAAVRLLKQGRASSGVAAGTGACGGCPVAGRRQHRGCRPCAGRPHRPASSKGRHQHPGCGYYLTEAYYVSVKAIRPTTTMRAQAGRRPGLCNTRRAVLRGPHVGPRRQHRPSHRRRRKIQSKHDPAIPSERTYAWFYRLGSSTDSDLSFGPAQIRLFAAPSNRRRALWTGLEVALPGCRCPTINCSTGSGRNAVH